MPDTNDTGPAPPAAPAIGQPGTETRESLAALRTIEEHRLADEAAAERARREREAAERAEAERRDRETAAERARQADVEAMERRRADVAAAERARLLDVDRRLAERERELRQEFELERARMAAELARAQADSASLGGWLVRRGLIVAVVGALIVAAGGWWLKQRVRREITMERVLAAAMERTRCEAQLKPLRRNSEEHAARTAQLDRELIDARDRASRAETRVLELERAPTRPRPTRAAIKPARPSAPNRIETDASDDPLGDLMSPTRRR